MNADLNLDAVKDMALDVWEDLGRTRLAGVAVGLALALLAITAIVLRPASPPDANADYSAAAAVAPEDAVSFTVPGQKQMKMSDVELSSPRDPFQSLDGGDSSSADQTLIAAGDSVQDAVTTATSGGSGGSTSTAGYGGSSSLVPLGDLSPTPASTPVDDPPATTHGDLGDAGDEPEPDAPREPASAPVTDYSYAVDIQFGLVDDLKRYASVQRLGLVPSRRVPLLMYLGVSTDHKTAVFMVDSRFSQGGEGTCVPNESLCTFLELAPTADRDEHHFRDADGSEYLLRLRRITRTSASVGSLHGRNVAELPGSPSVVDGAR
jgi:hypothetical protein